MPPDLPAILAASEITLAAAAAGTTAARRAFALLWRPRFVHYQGTSHKRSAVTCLDCLLSSRIVADLYESESPGFATETVPKNANAVDLHTRFFEKCLDVRFHSLVGQIAYEQLNHFVLS
jgi:hypothetical protein